MASRRPDPDPRTYARNVIQRKIDLGYTADEIAGYNGGASTPAGFGHPDNPRHGYTIGLGYNHGAPRLPNGDLRPLKRGQIGVHVGDHYGEYSIRELVREINAGASQPRLL